MPKPKSDDIRKWLNRQSTFFWMLSGIGMITLTGVLDVVTGYELAFSLFYLIPISLVTWYTNLRTGLVVSLLSVLALWIADTASGRSYSSPAIFVWNSLIRFAFFLVVTMLLARLKLALRREQILSRTDSLTGAGNTRSFYDALEDEIEALRQTKLPLTVAYIDLDNFKMVNDALGHAVGDQLLCDLVNVIRRHLSVSHRIARLGGDEFALLLPNTDCAAAQLLMSKIRMALGQEIARQQRPVTLSIGVVCWTKPPPTSGTMITQADNLMYLAKGAGKNCVKYLFCNEAECLEY